VHLSISFASRVFAHTFLLKDPSDRAERDLSIVHDQNRPWSPEAPLEFLPPTQRTSFEAPDVAHPERRQPTLSGQSANRLDVHPEVLGRFPTVEYVSFVGHACHPPDCRTPLSMKETHRTESYRSYRTVFHHVRFSYNSKQRLSRGIFRLSSGGHPALQGRPVQAGFSAQPPSSETRAFLALPLATAPVSAAREKKLRRVGVSLSAPYWPSEATRLFTVPMMTSGVTGFGRSVMGGCCNAFCISSLSGYPVRMITGI